MKGIRWQKERCIVVPQDRFQWLLKALQQFRKDSIMPFLAIIQAGSSRVLSVEIFVKMTTVSHIFPCDFHLSTVIPPIFHIHAYSPTRTIDAKYFRWWQHRYINHKQQWYFIKLVFLIISYFLPIEGAGFSVIWFPSSAIIFSLVFAVSRV